MHQPEQTTRILEDGHGDIISLGRSALANPNWPRRLALGLPFEQFDHQMIQPHATLGNTHQWVSRQTAS